MKALAIIALLAGAVHAGPIITPPTGWTGGANTDLVTRTGAQGHFGGVHGVVEAEQYAAPAGVVLYATRISANSASRDTAARAEIEAMRPAAPTKWEENVDAVNNRIEVRAESTDPATKVVDTSYLVIVAGGGSVIVAAKAECVAAPDADKTAADACRAAFASLDPGIDVKNRVALAPAAVAPPLPAPSAGPPPATMTDGSRTPIPPIVVKQDEPAADRRPIYVGAGIVFLTAVFWWNRRRRERFEREETPDDR